MTTVTQQIGNLNKYIETYKNKYIKLYEHLIEIPELTNTINEM